MANQKPDSAPPPERSASGDNRPDDRFLVEFLRGRDQFCPLCKYNLRDLTSPRCPECGRTIELTVGMTEPYMALWITTTVFLLMVAGLGVMLLMMVTTQGWPPGPERVQFMWFTSIFSSWIGLVFAPATIVYRRRFLSLNRESQLALAVLGAVLFAVTFIAAGVALSI